MLAKHHDRNNPPQEGERVTFSFFELTNGGKPTGGSNRSSFLGDREAEVAANTSGLPTLWNNKYTLPETGKESQSADNWGVPIDHL